MNMTQYLMSKGYTLEEIQTIFEEMEYRSQQESWVAQDPYGDESMDWDAFDDAQSERLWPEADEVA